MLKIMHIYANKLNLGDWNSALGIQKILKECYNSEIRFYERFLFDEFTDRDILLINNEIDCVVVGGGGLFFKKDNSIGWLWSIDKDLLMQITKPVFFYAVGLNENINNKVGKINKIIEKKIKNIFLNKPNFILGVRDQLTYRWALSLGIKNTFLVPCPSLMLAYPPQAKNGENTIGINFVPREYLTYPDYIENQIKMVVTYIKSLGMNCKLISHIANGPSAYEKELALRYDIPWVSVSHSYEIYSVYNNLQAAIVMRAHPILFSISQNTPVIPIIYNKKSTAFLELFDYPYMVNMPLKIWDLVNNRFSREICKILASIFSDKHTLNFKIINDKIRQYKKMNYDFAKRILNIL